MTMPEEPLAAENLPDPAPSGWRPPLPERNTVAVVSGLLAAMLGFVVVFSILRWEVKGVGWGFGGNLRFSTRSPFWMGLLTGCLSFLVTGGSIFLCSMVKIRQRSWIRRGVISTLGFFLAGWFGLTFGHESVIERPSETEMLFEVEYYLHHSRSYSAPESWRINSAKADFAGLGTGLGCGTLASISLYKLYERREGVTASGTKTAAKGEGPNDA